MATSSVKYIGDLRTLAVHLKSNNEIITDAPVDNKGKGEAFSPTDLLATSLASCMLTIMGIKANEHHINIENVTATVTKIMSSNPRRVGEILIDFNFNGMSYSEKEKTILRRAAETCPVALSLSNEVKQELSFNF